nr:uncharacterized protein LOC103349457 isoform X2 [Oryctolagus cuniculus]
MKKERSIHPLIHSPSGCHSQMTSAENLNVNNHSACQSLLRAKNGIPRKACDSESYKLFSSSLIVLHLQQRLLLPVPTASETPFLRCPVLTGTVMLAFFPAGLLHPRTLWSLELLRLSFLLSRIIYVVTLRKCWAHDISRKQDVRASGKSVSSHQCHDCWGRPPFFTLYKVFQEAQGAFIRLEGLQSKMGFHAGAHTGNPSGFWDLMTERRGGAARCFAGRNFFQGFVLPAGTEQLQNQPEALGALGTPLRVHYLRLVTSTTLRTLLTPRYGLSL